MISKSCYARVFMFACHFQSLFLIRLRSRSLNVPLLPQKLGGSPSGSKVCLYKYVYAYALIHARAHTHTRVLLAHLFIRADAGLLISTYLRAHKVSIALDL